MSIADSTPAFSGFFPEIYDRYSVPIYFDPFAAELVSRVEPFSLKSVLEIGCGTGALTKVLSTAMMPGTTLIASDINNDMLEFARKKLQHEDIKWMNANGADLPFADNSFDLVLCQFGYMFMPDKPKAFREAHRVLRAGGNLLFSTWDKLENNPSGQITRRLFAQMFGDLPSESYLPFIMNNHNELQSLLEGAGFVNIAIETVSKIAIAASAMDAVHSAARAGLIYNEIMKRNHAALPEFEQALFKEFVAAFGDTPMMAPMQAVVSSAWKKAASV